LSKRISKALSTSLGCRAEESLRYSTSCTIIRTLRRFFHGMSRAQPSKPLDEIHPGAIKRFKSVSEKHPELLTNKMPRKRYPEKVMEVFD
jgi:hypothetical protein